MGETLVVVAELGGTTDPTLLMIPSRTEWLFMMLLFLTCVSSRSSRIKYPAPSLSSELPWGSGPRLPSDSKPPCEECRLRIPGDCGLFCSPTSAPFSPPTPRLGRLPVDWKLLLELTKIEDVVLLYVVEVVLELDGCRSPLAYIESRCAPSRGVAAAGADAPAMKSVAGGGVSEAGMRSLMVLNPPAGKFARASTFIVVEVEEGGADFVIVGGTFAGRL